MLIVTTPPTQLLPNAAAIAITNPGQPEQIICSGIGIDHALLLTAGHCAVELARLSERAFVRLKKEDRTVESFRIISWQLHPSYQDEARSDLPDLDVALVKYNETESRGTRLSVHIPSSTPTANSPLWMQGYSPFRLGQGSVANSLASVRAWIPLRFQSFLPGSGKFTARASGQGNAACPGDSGSPVWSLGADQAALVGIVVQGDCAHGRVNVVELSSLRDWLRDTALSLSGFLRDPPEWMKTFPTRLFASGHRP